ncbi:MAG: hypothetical protein ABIP97_13925 [Chthoniobacterales bacterium]
MGVETGLLAVSLISTAVGTGVSMYGQKQQADNVSRISGYNEAVAKQNADVQAQLAEYQYHTNAQIDQAQYDASQANAQTLENQATGTENMGRMQIDRLRQQNDVFQGTQRERYAASGVTPEGSPLEVMAHTAGQLQQNVQDSLFQTNQAAQKFRSEADLQRYQGSFSLMDKSIQDYAAAAAATGRGSQYQTAAINRMAGENQAQGLVYSSYGTLLNGITQEANQGFNYKNPSGGYRTTH